MASGVAVLVVVGWLALALSPAVRTGLLAVLLLPELFNAPGPRPLVLVSGQPTRSELRIARADADLYRPAGGGRHGALVVTAGVHPLDKRDPVLARLAEGLARVGLYVLLVQSDELIADRIEPDEPGNLVAAIERLRGESGVEPRHVGILGFSAGASLAFLAAADPIAADHVRTLIWLGGYYDAVELVRDIQSQSYEDDGHTMPWTPHELTAYVFRKQLEDAGVDPTTPASQLPARVVERLAAVSPRGVVGRFRARAYVLVDRADPLVPFVHSRELARALPPDHLARYVEFDIFEHVQPTKPVPLTTFVRETWKLWFTTASILAELDPAK